ncbi:MAG: hypothetical protein WA191_00635 [Telluria sp.]|nr:hypothetical protein [Telluria sp.]
MALCARRFTRGGGRGKYEVMGIDPSEGWLESGRVILPFDELGKD